jgi:segregation and condensation protein A
LSQILHIARSERAVICLQLAVLELVRLQAILLRQDRNFSDILLKRSTAVAGS